MLVTILRKRYLYCELFSELHEKLEFSFSFLQNSQVDIARKELLQIIHTVFINFTAFDSEYYQKYWKLAMN